MSCIVPRMTHYSKYKKTGPEGPVPNILTILTCLFDNATNDCRCGCDGRFRGVYRCGINEVRHRRKSQCRCRQCSAAPCRCLFHALFYIQRLHIIGGICVYHYRGGRLNNEFAEDIQFAPGIPTTGLIEVVVAGHSRNIGIGRIEQRSGLYAPFLGGGCGSQRGRSEFQHIVGAVKRIAFQLTDGHSWGCIDKARFSGRRNRKKSPLPGYTGRGLLP